MRQSSPATERNRYPLLEVLRYRLKGRVLEVGSGTGQHARFFSENLYNVEWIPSDIDEESLASIAAWREGGPKNLAEPLRIDVHDEDWGLSELNAIVAINLIHIAPWSATEALFKGAVRHAPGGPVIMYGPYKRDGKHTAKSNEQFEEWLHSLDEAYGVRDMDAVAEVAKAFGYEMEEPYPMPANNFTLCFKAV